MRDVKLERLTNYQIESYMGDLSRLFSLKATDFIKLPIGYLLKDNQIQIFHEKMLSLFDLIHNTK
jgi:hypothetical protein